MTQDAARPTLAEARAHLAAVDTYEPQAPQDPVAESEYAVLGAAIQSAAATQEAAAILSPHHFREGSNEAVFKAALTLADAGQPVEPASVLAELGRAGVLVNVHGPNMGNGGAFLASLMARAGSIGYHAPIVIGDWLRRNVAQVLKTCEAIAIRTDFDPDEHLDLIRKRIEDATSYAGSTALRPQSEVVLEVLDAVEKGIDPGLSTGYPDLDGAIGGLRPGELIIIGARPGVGKSVLGLNIADHLSTQLGLSGLFASLEMREEELTHRRIAATATVPLTHLTRHMVSDADWHQINRAHERLTSSRLRVDDTPGVSLAQVRGQLRSMVRTGCAARFLVGDYLGIFATPKADNRQQAVAELARGFKLIAREFGIPVIVLAQLNRSPETRSDKRPVLSDLRESGEVEAAADIVMLLHREDAYERESPRAGEIDIIIAKNRQGPLCTATHTFQGHYARITSMSADWSPSRTAE